jgi:hypothetical protein
MSLYYITNLYNKGISKRKIIFSKFIIFLRYCKICKNISLVIISSELFVKTIPTNFFFLNDCAIKQNKNWADDPK